MPGVARLGDISSHGGFLTLPVAKSVRTNGRPTAHLGTIHVCPIPFHPPTPIFPGKPSVRVEGKPIATIGEKAGCGAVVVTGSGDVRAG
ncbi:MAG: hypothetical protein CL844_05110 [Crocinitomicaceae bacterium]|nr:hypothetical protein [Crocinitomicaceae bacterium]